MLIYFHLCKVVFRANFHLYALFNFLLTYLWKTYPCELIFSPSTKRYISLRDEMVLRFNIHWSDFPSQRLRATASRVQEHIANLIWLPEARGFNKSRCSEHPLFESLAFLFSPTYVSISSSEQWCCWYIRFVLLHPAIIRRLASSFWRWFNRLIQTIVSLE